MTKFMKRLCAAGIDYFIFVCISMIVLTFFIIGTGPYKTYNTLDTLFNAYLWIATVFLFLYFFMQDFFFRGRSIGKRIVQLELVNKEKTIGFAVKHSLFKLLAGMLWPVTLVFYFVKHRMFYDKILGIEEV